MIYGKIFSDDVNRDTEDKETKYCDNCGKPMTKKEYEKNQGLCYRCIENIN